MSKKVQMSETISIGTLLALSGGLMDAYSYIFRDHVFANAQTGNIILFGVNLSQGDFQTAFKYFCPIIAFAFGIILSEVLRSFGNKYGLHWRQIGVFFEILILSAVAFISTDYNLLANSLTSLACGIQVQAFKKIYSNSIATTMCIGNLRSGTENFYRFVVNGNRVHLKKAFLYYGIILCFVTGAIMGNVFIKLFEAKAILSSSFILFIAFLLMFLENVDPIVPYK